MKRLFLLILACLLLAGTAYADSSITFKWSKNSESDLAGYKLYRSSAPDGQVIDGTNFIAIILSNNEIYDHNLIPDLAADKEALTLTGVADGTWYFVLTAYDTSDNESGKSNEVSARVDTMAPGNPIILEIIAIVKAP